MSNELSRRDFLGACSAAACAVTLSLAEASGSPPGAAYTGTLCLFSKPLAAMDWRRLAQAAKSVGFGGIDLTVRRGAQVWDMASVIDALDPKWAGFYFDARHAVAEGGVGGWKIATNLVMPRLKMVAVKDFRWEKLENGWTPKNCPLGEGMVDWRYFANALAAGGFQGPISLHLEYDVAGETAAAREEDIVAALQRDLQFLKARLREGYGAIAGER